MKNIKYFVIGAIVGIIAFVSFYKNSYCAQASLIGQALLNSYSIASEYYCARAGRNIVNADEVSTDITGISGINQGVLSHDYSKIFSDNANITIDYIMSNIRDVDVSEMSAADKAKLASIMAASNNVPYAYKAFTLGGITLYFAVDELGNWIGDSYDNIVCKFQSMTADKTTTTQNAATTLFGTNIPSCLVGQNIGFTLHRDNNVNTIMSYNYSANYDIYVYADNGTYYAVIPESELISFVNANQANFNGHTHLIMNGTTPFDYEYIRLGYSNSIRPYTFQINGVTYYYGPFADNRYYTDEKTFSSLQEVQSLLEAYALSGYPAYESELIDNSNVPYVVPDLDGYGATIGDLYPILDNLRDTILTIPDADSIASALTGSLEDTIQDLIDSIKELAISVPIVDEQDIITEPIEFTGTTVPNGFPSDIFDPITDALSANFGIFSFFEPLFYIFGTFNGIFALWTFVPMLIIILLIVWALK